MTTLSVPQGEPEKVAVDAAGRVVAIARIVGDGEWQIVEGRCPCGHDDPLSVSVGYPLVVSVGHHWHDDAYLDCAACDDQTDLDDTREHLPLGTLTKLDGVRMRVKAEPPADAPQPPINIGQALRDSLQQQARTAAKQDLLSGVDDIRAELERQNADHSQIWKIRDVLRQVRELVERHDLAGAAINAYERTRGPQPSRGDTIDCAGGCGAIYITARDQGPVGGWMCLACETAQRDDYFSKLALTITNPGA